MSRILITGSADGLGLMAARLLIEQDHEVVLHARDLSSIAAVRSVAEQANASGRFDAVVHNAAVGYQEPWRIATVDGLAHVFAMGVAAVERFAGLRRFQAARHAPDDLDQAHRTQAWLAVEGNGTGGYYYHREPAAAAAAATDPEVQDRLVTACAELTGTPLPR